MATNPTPGVFFSLADLGLPTTQAEFMAIWLAGMQAQYPGYSPDRADPLYVFAQIGASWAAALAQMTNAGATELFRNYGTQLFGLPYQQGVPAQAVVTVTAQDTAGYTLPAFTQLTLAKNGAAVGFETAATLNIAPGNLDGNVTVIARTAGTAANGSGAPAALTGITWIADVTVVSAASDGADQQSDDQFVNVLADEIQNPEPPVTASNFAAAALRFTPAPATDQQLVGRATSVDGYNPAVTSFTATTNGTTTVSAVSSFAGISVGSIIAAADITAGQTVTALNTGAGTLTLSTPATGSHTAETMTSTGSYGNQRNNTVCVTDASGVALNSDTMTAVAAYLAGMREINFVVNVVAPSYTLIYAGVTVVASGSYDPATVQANVQAALLGLLNPTTFGLPQGATQGWNNSLTIPLSQVIAAIQNANGVQEVVPGTLALGTSPSPSAVTADFVIGGAFPLPMTSTVSIPLSAITVNT